MKPEWVVVRSCERVHRSFNAVVFQDSDLEEDNDNILRC